MNKYVCSRCGEEAYYDGRCGDGPVLQCSCVSRGYWVNDGRGGYMIYPGNPEPIDAECYVQPYNPWSNDRR